MTKPLAWSYSALSTWRTCPKKFYHLRVAKDIKEEESEAMVEGREIHDAMYKRVCKGVALPLPLRHHEKIAARFADTEGEIHGEMKICLNKKLEAVGWFADDAWVRAVLDLIIIKGDTAIIVDWKTGRRRDEFDQLELAAAMLSRLMPEVEKFRLTFVWLQNGEISPFKELKKEDMKQVWMKFMPVTEEIENARATTTFPATPSGLCGWCPVYSCPHYTSGR